MKNAMSKVMGKAIGMIHSAKKKAAMLTLALSMALVSGSTKLTAFASEGGGSGSTFDATTVMTGAVDSAKSQMFAMLGVVVPAIVAITVAVIGVKFAISWIKKIRG